MSKPVKTTRKRPGVVRSDSSVINALYTRYFAECPYCLTFNWLCLDGSDIADQDVCRHLRHADCEGGLWKFIKDPEVFIPA